MKIMLGLTSQYDHQDWSSLRPYNENPKKKFLRLEIFPAWLTTHLITLQESTAGLNAGAEFQIIIKSRAVD